MNPRAGNVAILLLLVFELVSGFGSFLIGAPDGRWLFWLHRAGGLTLIVLLVWKISISKRSLRRRGFTTGTGLAALGGVPFLASLATGSLWTTVGMGRVSVPIFGSWTVLSLHVALSLFLIPPFLVHLGPRWPRPGRADPVGRRAVLRMLGLLALGFAVWGAQESLSALVTPSTSSRRFTGSHEEASFAGNDHPVTNWLSDPIPRIEAGDWQLRIHGDVEREAVLSYEEFQTIGDVVREATPDRTGGWYTVQRWSGTPVDTLLEETGDLLLATHVEDEALSAGHGFPLRLVAPDHAVTRGSSGSPRWKLAATRRGSSPRCPSVSPCRICAAGSG